MPVNAAIEPAERRRMSYPEAEAAELLGISVRSLFGLRKAGRILGFKVGTRVLYSARALRTFIRESEARASAGADADLDEPIPKRRPRLPGRGDAGEC